MQVVIRFTLENSKPSKDNFIRNAHKTIDKSRFSVILNLENYLEKYLVNLNNGLCQLLKNITTPKVKAKALKHLEALKQIIIDNQLYYYLESSDSLPPKFYS